MSWQPSKTACARIFLVVDSPATCQIFVFNLQLVVVVVVAPVVDVVAAAAAAAGQAEFSGYF